MIIGKASRGLKVKKLQYRLGLEVDGIFGKNTVKGVNQWQEKNNLNVTGEMRDKDWMYMFGCKINDWTPIGIVVHSMSEYITYKGTKLKAKDFLKKIGLSVHADITPDGLVEVMKLTDEKALHAGVSEHNGLSGLNEYFLGFEVLVEGNNSYGEFLEKIKKDTCYTKEQFKSAVMLTRTWMEEYHIPLKDVVRHEDISGPDVRPHDPKKDPGPGFDWELFKKKISE